MNFHEYRPLGLATVKPMEHEAQVKHAILGMITEIGELADNVKRNFVYEKPLDMVNGEEEIGDICWYLNLYCAEMDITGHELDVMRGKAKPCDTLLDAVLDIVKWLGLLGSAPTRWIVEGLVSTLTYLCLHFETSLDTALDRNIAKLKKRYPDNYSNEAALARADKASNDPEPARVDMSYPAETNS